MLLENPPVTAENLDIAPKEPGSNREQMIKEMKKNNTVLFVTDDDTDPWKLQETVTFLADTLYIENPIIDISTFTGISIAETFFLKNKPFDTVGKDVWDINEKPIDRWFKESLREDTKEILQAATTKVVNSIREKKPWSDVITNKEIPVIIIPGHETLTITETATQEDTVEISLQFNQDADTNCGKIFRERLAAQDTHFRIIFPPELAERADEENVSSLRKFDVYNLTMPSAIETDPETIVEK